MTQPYNPQYQQQAPQGYAPQAPAAPQYAQQQYAQPPAPQNYAPNTGYVQPQVQQAPPAYAPQGYTQPQQAFAPQAPVQQEQYTAADFWGQPSGGSGPALSWPQIGTVYNVAVARDVRNTDVHPQTDPKKQPGQEGYYKTFTDGRKKLEIRIPLRLQPSQAYPQGEATFYVKGADRDELVRAMQAAGVTPDQDGALWPKAGDTFQVHYFGDKPNRMGAPTKQKQITYTVGNGTVPQEYLQPAVQQFQQAPPQQYAQQPQQFAPPQAPNGYAQAYVQQAPPAPPQYAAPPQQFQQAPPPPAPPQPGSQLPPGGIPGLSPEQQAQVMALNAGQFPQPGQPVANPQP